MLVPCMILRPFAYSLDGFTTRRAEAGSVVDIPAELVSGLARAGYVDAKAIAAAPENKAMVVPENKAASLDPDDIEGLRARVADLGVTVDRRWREGRLREELAKAGG